MQALAKWLIGGVIGGTIGVAIWIAIGYYTSCEGGWIAWGVGFLVGFGVRAAAGKKKGWGPAFVAGGIAVCAVLIAKSLVVDIAVSKVMSKMPDEMVSVTTEMGISRCAWHVVREQEMAGNTIDWPSWPEDKNASPELFYPKEIWAAAKQRWESKTPEEQEQIKADVLDFQNDMVSQLRQLGPWLREMSSKESFSPWNIFWFGLAVFTAFKIGSGVAYDLDYKITGRGKTSTEP